MGSIIAMVNMKGGVGKTTVTVNLATCLVKNYGRRVLVVDLDTQINATLSLMPPSQFTELKQKKYTLKTLIDQAHQSNKTTIIPIQKIIKHNICQVRGLDLLPGDIDLYDDFLLSEVIYSQSQGEQKNFTAAWNYLEDNLIRKVLKPVIHDYDWIIMDFSPGDHLMTRSGILASDYYIIPAKPEPLSVIGIGILEGRIKQLKESKRTNIKLMGLVFTSLGRASNMTENVKNRLSYDLGKEIIFQTEIPMNVAIARAVEQYQPVVITEPQSPGAKAFYQLSQEFLDKFVKIPK
jgi:cellulose biosynthesis protein BcsQ